ncbi:hypothetical protein B0A55_12243 [Friedmanniomyces simplex]|uniref:Uncharacterized protein n=1 Tax=Friedmanniomyces simplex TaxID=329884 RepID=A0A4U0VQQ3_9PEZI|nr:hypothetical protein B0A55_12243 [Friedmanniomyces simplex]
MADSFNPRTPDVDGIAYYSYGATLRPRLTSVFRKSHSVVQAEEGPNDGLVSVSSAKWGTYKGTLDDVSHLDLINWTNKLRWWIWELTGHRKHFNAIAFYLDIADMLAKEGFELVMLWDYFCHPCYDHQNAVWCMCKSIPGVPGWSMTGEGPRLSCRGTGKLSGGAKHGIVVPAPVRDDIDRQAASVTLPSESVWPTDTMPVWDSSDGLAAPRGEAEESSLDALTTGGDGDTGCGGAVALPSEDERQTDTAESSSFCGGKDADAQTSQAAVPTTDDGVGNVGTNETGGNINETSAEQFADDFV